MTLSEYVRNYREEHFLSQRTFARRCGLSNAVISLIERGMNSNGDPFTPTGNTLVKLARGMGITTDVLMASCEDFTIDISDDDSEGDKLIKGFIDELQKKEELPADEQMLLQAYRAIPAEHRIEAMSAILLVKAKYEN